MRHHPAAASYLVTCRQVQNSSAIYASLRAVLTQPPQPARVAGRI